MPADSASHFSSSRPTYEVNGFQIFPESNEIVSDTTQKKLKPGTMDFLVYLLEQAPRIVSSDELLTNLWPETVGDDSLVHRQVSKIRAAFGDNAKSAGLIETLPKRGYRITAVVRVSVANQSDIDMAELPTLVVQPLDPIGASDTLIHWCAGFTGELQSLLTGMPNLTLLVASNDDAPKSDFELRGSARFHRQRFRLTAFLIRTSDGAQVWSGIYDLLQDDVEQEESLGAAIAFRVQSEVAFDQRRAGANSDFQNVNKEAIKLHLQALNHYRLARLGDLNSWELYQRSLEKAVELDEGFAAAHFDLAEFYALRIGKTPYDEASIKAKHALAKGMMAQPESVLGFQRLGQIQLSLDLDYAGATESFNAALSIDPTAKWCYFGLARIALRKGDVEACRHHLDIACELDVLVGESLFLNAAGGYYAQIGDTDKGLRMLDQALRIVPQGIQRVWLLGVKAGVLAWMSGTVDQKRLSDILDEMIAITGTDQMVEFAAFFSVVGKERRAREIMSNLPAGGLNPAFVAQGYFGIGDLDHGFKWLEQGLRERVDFVLDGIRIGQSWDPVRNDVRFMALLTRLEQMEALTGSPSV